MVQWSDELDRDARIKLSKTWEDITHHRAFRYAVDQLEAYIQDRMLDSAAASVNPRQMEPPDGRVPVIGATNDQLLSLIEAEHESLQWLAENPHQFGLAPYPGASPEWLAIIRDAPERFRRRVNAILESHLVALSLHQNSELVPVQSQEMHDEVVEPTTRLLHSQPHFSQVEIRYQDALRELRAGYPDDAITDAAAALEDMLLALGCTGNSLTELLKCAKQTGLLRASDAKFTSVLSQTIEWVKDVRNAGEAHGGDTNYSMSDAWMLVHILGALTIRLTETGAGQGQSGGDPR
ncbi:hypothetical protein A5714_11605 [Mycobacterium sp. E2462]|nr:hypothetical protein A5714_11605 [Mycobacterium sp. E2462]